MVNYCPGGASCPWFVAQGLCLSCFQLFVPGRNDFDSALEGELRVDRQSRVSLSHKTCVCVAGVTM